MTTSQTLATATIPTLAECSVSEKLKKTNRRAAKLGLAPLTLRVIERRIVSSEDGYEAVSRVEIIGEPIRLDGWALAGVIEHSEAGNIVRAVPGVELPIAYRSAKSTCDHCQTSRRRNDTVVVTHDDGRMMRVGKSCLRDFLGHDPASLLFVATLGEVLSERSDGSRCEWFSLVEYLRWVAMSIRLDGWISKSEAAQRVGYQATADHALAAMFKPAAYRTASDPRPTEADHARASAALAYAREHISEDATSDYLYNLRTIVAQDTVTYRRAGIAASVLAWYDREIGREIERRERAKSQTASQFVGSVKERIDFQACVIYTRHMESEWGVSTLIRLMDDAGNVFVWFASGSREVAIGERFIVRATVKGHDEYQGIKTTKITRATLTGVSK